MEGRSFLFLLFLVLPALTQAGCPEGWVAIDDCCYYFSDDKVSFDEAKYDCDYLEGELVSFDDCETLEDVTSSGEPCPYWIHPTTDLDCLEPYPEEYNKYICKVPLETGCQQYCSGQCLEPLLGACYDGRWVDSYQCSCPGNTRCCVQDVRTQKSCAVDCEGECIVPDPNMDNLGCDRTPRDPDECPCPYDMICCCREEPTPTEEPTTTTPCPETPKPSFTDDNGCVLPEAETIPDDTVFDFEAVYDSLMEYRSDPYAADVKFDQVKEQFEKLGKEDGESLSGMRGDLTDAIRAEQNVYVLEYTDSETGYEMGIMLPDFDPKTGVLPADLDFTGPAFGYEFKEKLLLLKQRYAELKLNVHIPDFIPNECEFVVDIQLNAHFRLRRVPLVLVACVTIECELVIVVPVVCFEITCEWIGEPICEWEFQVRIVIKKIIIHLTYWVRVWWISAFPQMAIQQLPDCPAPGMGDIAPFEEFNPGFMDIAIDNFQSSVSEGMAGELNVNTFRAVYDMDLGEQGGTALTSMEGSVTSRVNGFKDRWVLTYKESDDDVETSILLDEFDPTVDELPDAYDLGDLSAFGSYSQRYLQLFSYRYMEMRATVSLRAIFPTNCGTAVVSVRLDARFRLRRLPFFLMACWEISFTEYLIIPVPCYEIYIICGIRVVLPVIKVIIIRRSFWFGLWVFPLPAPCPLPPAPTPGSRFALGNPNGRNHGDTCEYRCDWLWQECLPFVNPLVCLWGQWWFQPLQLQCSRECPPAPPAGFGAFRVVCFPVWGKPVKEICFYDCFPGWVPCWGNFVRMCVNGRWTGWPLICLPPWIPKIGGRLPRPPPGDPHLPCDCKDIHDMDPTLPSGIYMIYPKDDQPGFLVYCDMETDGGGWTVFQRRQDGSVDFYLDWDDYKHGFPYNMTGEFWLGNDKIHRLTAQKNYTLRVDLEANDGETAYAEYGNFSVNDVADNYRINIAGYSGTAGDSMTATDGGQDLDGQAFSTFDDDNDVWADGSCAVRFKGAWWYCACSDSNLNGMYGNNMYGKGVVWKTFRGMSESLPFTEMKIRP